MAYESGLARMSRGRFLSQSFFRDSLLKGIINCVGITESEVAFIVTLQSIVDVTS